MAGDVKTRGAQDRARIKPDENHEVRYWTKEFGISTERLASIIARVRQFCGDGQIVARQVTASTRRPCFKRMRCGSTLENCSALRAPLPS